MSTGNLNLQAKDLFEPATLPPRVIRRGEFASLRAPLPRALLKEERPMRVAFPERQRSLARHQKQQKQHLPSNQPHSHSAADTYMRPTPPFWQQPQEEQSLYFSSQRPFNTRPSESSAEWTRQPRVYNGSSGPVRVMPFRPPQVMFDPMGHDQQTTMYKPQSYPVAVMPENAMMSLGMGAPVANRSLLPGEAFFAFHSRLSTTVTSSVVGVPLLPPTAISTNAVIASYHNNILPQDLSRSFLESRDAAECIIQEQQFLRGQLVLSADSGDTNASRIESQLTSSSPLKQSESDTRASTVGSATFVAELPSCSTSKHFGSEDSNAGGCTDTELILSSLSIAGDARKEMQLEGEQGENGAHRVTSEKIKSSRRDATTRWHLGVGNVAPEEVRIRGSLPQALCPTDEGDESTTGVTSKNVASFNSRHAEQHGIKSLPKHSGSMQATIAKRESTADATMIGAVQYPELRSKDTASSKPPLHNRGSLSAEQQKLVTDLSKKFAVSNDFTGVQQARLLRNHEKWVVSRDLHQSGHLYCTSRRLTKRHASWSPRGTRASSRPSELAWWLSAVVRANKLGLSLADVKDFSTGNSVLAASLLQDLKNRIPVTIRGSTNLKLTDLANKSHVNLTKPKKVKDFKAQQSEIDVGTLEMPEPSLPTAEVIKDKSITRRNSSTQPTDTARHSEPEVPIALESFAESFTNKLHVEEASASLYYTNPPYVHAVGPDARIRETRATSFLVQDGTGQRHWLMNPQQMSQQSMAYTSQMQQHEVMTQPHMTHNQNSHYQMAMIMNRPPFHSQHLLVTNPNSRYQTSQEVLGGEAAGIPSASLDSAPRKLDVGRPDSRHQNGGMFYDSPLVASVTKDGQSSSPKPLQRTYSTAQSLSGANEISAAESDRMSSATPYTDYGFGPTLGNSLALEAIPARSRQDSSNSMAGFYMLQPFRAPYSTQHAHSDHSLSRRKGSVELFQDRASDDLSRMVHPQPYYSTWFSAPPPSAWTFRAISRSIANSIRHFVASVDYELATKTGPFRNQIIHSLRGEILRFVSSSSSILPYIPPALRSGGKPRSKRAAFSVDVVAFGSCCTNLALPWSDIDLSITGLDISTANSPSDPKDAKYIDSRHEILAQLGNFFDSSSNWMSEENDSPQHNKKKMHQLKCRPEELQRFETPQFKPSRHTPLLTLHIKPDPTQKLLSVSSHVDISVHDAKHTGTGAIRTLKFYQAFLPTLRPLVLVLKQVLQRRKMNIPYEGGLSSYALCLMVIAFLQSPALYCYKVYDVAFYGDISVPSGGYVNLHYIRPGSQGIDALVRNKPIRVSSFNYTNFAISPMPPETFLKSMTLNHMLDLINGGETVSPSTPTAQTSALKTIKDRNGDVFDSTDQALGPSPAETVSSRPRRSYAAVVSCPERVSVEDTRAESTRSSPDQTSRKGGGESDALTKRFKHEVMMKDETKPWINFDGVQCSTPGCSSVDEKFGCRAKMPYSEVFELICPYSKVDTFIGSRLEIRDPVDPENNVGRPCWNVSGIKAVFSNAYRDLLTIEPCQNCYMLHSLDGPPNGCTTAITPTSEAWKAELDRITDEVNTVASHSVSGPSLPQGVPRELDAHCNCRDVLRLIL